MEGRDESWGMPMCERWNVEIRGIEGERRMAREVEKKMGTQSQKSVEMGVDRGRMQVLNAVGWPEKTYQEARKENTTWTEVGKLDGLLTTRGDENIC